MSNPITEKGKISSQKILIKVCEKVRRKCAEMREKSYVQSKIDT